jgi:hypothetical protein
MPPILLNEARISISSVSRTEKPQCKEKSIHINVNGKKINLIFSEEPNIDAEQFIKRSLVSAYLISEQLS